MDVRDIPHKVGHVLLLILIAFLLIFVRVWFLTTMKHDEYRECALRPQRRTIVDPAYRGTIRDRFNIPLAINKLQYNVAVCYDRIQEIPTVEWDREGGKAVKVYKRRVYIRKLSEMLGDVLNVDASMIEDLIHSKASIFPHTPFVIREEVPEQTYYKLRMREKEWTGLMMQKSSKRCYPQGKVASDIVGYIGPIDQERYFKIAYEIRELEEFLKKWGEGEALSLPKGFSNIQGVERRLSEIKEMAYTMHTLVGKWGIEKVFDESLRGVYGKRKIEIDAKGHFIRTLSDSKKEGIPGKRILLTLSSELQAYAEELLIQNEWERDKHFALAGKGHEMVRAPWVKGGAIVATIPTTGEVVALASYPRFDPNDFILTDLDREKKRGSIYKWLEKPVHVGSIWEGRRLLERERPGGCSGGGIEREVLSWALYLDMILSLDGEVRRGLKSIHSVKHAVMLQRDFSTLLQLSGCCATQLVDALYTQYWGHIPSQKHQKVFSSFAAEWLDLPLAMEARKNLDPILSPIKHNVDKLLLLDLLRVVVSGELFDRHHIDLVKQMPLDIYRQLNQAFSVVQSELKECVNKLYRKHLFPLWRDKYFKGYLKEKRKGEKAKRSYPRPYVDYLVEARESLFEEFWKENRWQFLDAFIFGRFSEGECLHSLLFHLIVQSPHLSEERGIQEPLKLLRAQHPELLHTFLCYHELSAPLWGEYLSLKGSTLGDLAGAYYPRYGFGYFRSSAYGSATTLGSLFKLVVGYEALKQTYLHHKEHNLPLQDLNPLTVIDMPNAKRVTKDGMVLGCHLDGELITRYYKGGRMPRSYAPLGKVDFLTAIECSSNIYFSLLAGGVIKYPTSLENVAKAFGFGRKTGIDISGEIGGYVPNDLSFNRTGLYAMAIGQHSLVVTPLQATMMLSALGNGGVLTKPQIVKLQADCHSVKEQRVEVRNTLLMPAQVQSELLEGMRRVVKGERGHAQPHRIRAFCEHPQWISEYRALQDQFIGKTSTAEFVYRPVLDRGAKSLICKEIWFGALSFKEGESYRYDMPDLSVVVYLKFGDYGKEAVPIAAKIIKKWLEIEDQHRR